MGPLGRTKFWDNRCPWVGMRPQIAKISAFWQRVAPHGRTLRPISTLLLRSFIRPTTCISVLHLTLFASQVTELLLRNREAVSYPEFFCAPCRKNYALDRKKMIDTCLMVSTSSINVQCLEKIVLRAPAVGAKIWCLFFIGHAECGAVFIRG